MFNFSMRALRASMPYLPVASLMTIPTAFVQDADLDTKSQNSEPNQMGYLPLVTFRVNKYSPQLTALEQHVFKPVELTLKQRQRKINQQRQGLDAFDSTLDEIDKFATGVGLGSALVPLPHVRAIGSGASTGILVATTGIRSFLITPKKESLEKQELAIRNHFIHSINEQMQLTQSGISKAEMQKMIDQTLITYPKESKPFARAILNDELNNLTKDKKIITGYTLARRQEALAEKAQECELSPQQFAELKADSEIIKKEIAALAKEYKIQQEKVQTAIEEAAKANQDYALRESCLSIGRNSAAICLQIGVLSGSQDMQTFGAVAGSMVDIIDKTSNFVNSVELIGAAASSGVSVSWVPVVGPGLAVVTAVLSLMMLMQQQNTPQNGLEKNLRALSENMINGFKHLDEKLDYLIEGQKQIRALVRFSLKTLEQQLHFYHRDMQDTLARHEKKLDILLIQTAYISKQLENLTWKPTYEKISMVIHNKPSDYRVMEPENFYEVRDIFYSGMRDWDTIFKVSISSGPKISAEDLTSKTTVSLSELDSYMALLLNNKKEILSIEDKDAIGCLAALYNMAIALGFNLKVDAALCNPFIWTDIAKAYMILICNSNCASLYNNKALSLEDEESKVREALAPMENYLAFLKVIQSKSFLNKMVSPFIEIQKALKSKIEESHAAFLEQHKDYLALQPLKINPFDIEGTLLSNPNLSPNDYLILKKILPEGSTDPFKIEDFFPYAEASKASESPAYKISERHKQEYIEKMGKKFEDFSHALELHLLMWKKMNQASMIGDAEYLSIFPKLDEINKEVRTLIEQFKSSKLSIDTLLLYLDANLKKSEIFTERLKEIAESKSIFDTETAVAFDAVKSTFGEIPNYLELVATVYSEPSNTTQITVFKDMSSHSEEAIASDPSFRR